MSVFTKQLMHTLLNTLAAKKARLDAHRPLPPALVKNLEDWFRVELTYTSNAIEGNTLSRNETALVIEKGITIGGKTINEHLEAENHAAALAFIQGLVDRSKEQLGISELLGIHRIVLDRIDTHNAGKFRNIAVRIAGSSAVLPNPAKVPLLIEQFFSWLHTVQEDAPKVAADAHFKLVTIHPFTDGNGRTARLLMNLLLMQTGYPPAIIQKEERLAYINAIEAAESVGDFSTYYPLIYQAIERSLDIYLNAVEAP